MTADARKFDFLINKKAGTVLRDGEDLVAKNLRDAFGERTGEIRFIGGGDIAPAVRDWAAVNKGADRAIVVGGGDGSLLAAAAEVLNTDVTLGVLPLGTQNFIARELGYSPDYAEAAKQYAVSSVRTMDVGTVNGIHFLYTIAIDPNCVNFFEARELAREGKILPALHKAFIAAGGLAIGRRMRITVAHDGQTNDESGRIIAISNNSFCPRPMDLKTLTSGDVRQIAGKICAKDGEGDQTLAFYAFRGGFLSTGILRRIYNGTWDQASAVHVRRAQNFVIDTPDADKKVSIIMDGEIKETAFPLKVSLIPQSLRLYRPQV